MGAFGAALIARERYQEGEKTTMLSIDQDQRAEIYHLHGKLPGCTNNCRLTINKFSGGRQYISGNRCERGIGRRRTRIISRTFSNTNIKGFFSYNLFPQIRLPEDRLVSHVF